jgi:predicted negative regulator of RcsB-dependent stress response
VDINQTEEQQVAAIKGFWKENGNAIIAGLFLGFSGFIGYGYYQDHKLQQELMVADSYQAVVELLDGDETQYRDAATSFINEHGDTSYASLASLALAKNAAEHQDWTEVAKHLKSALEQSVNSGITGIATVRLARVQVQLGEYDEAITTLSSSLPASFTAAVEETKGDAYLKQNNIELARNAYQVALSVEGSTPSPSLQMKLDDLVDNVTLVN